ncbi:MAG: hypothetical protein GY705_30740 [Bacteroidetes bacterium]|nr:hypothetical protein [Bacteroidota bacterium]
MISLKKQIRIIYFILLCCICVGLSSVREKPIYGKLDFLLLDGKPWWPSWKPMIEYALTSGNTPIISDIITSGILHGVFSQPTLYSFKVTPPEVLLIDKIDEKIRPTVKILPVGSFSLLLSATSSERREIIELMIDYIGQYQTLSKENPFFFTSDLRNRCIVNLHGFTPSWVPYETKHWKPRLAKTMLFYRYNYSRISEIEIELKKNPPTNCRVFYSESTH